MFRTGSVSKVYTAYALLIAGGKGMAIFDDKVTKYVPELMREEAEELDPLTQIRWEEISLGALVNQEGGVGGPGKFLFLLVHL